MDYYQKLAIIISAIAVVVIGLGIVTILLLKRKNKNKKIEEFPDLLIALGGKENITKVSQKGSRVSVIVDNKKSIDKDKIKEQGVETIVISNKKVTMVVGTRKSILMFNYLNDQVSL
jgi:phosphotransferase system IIB component